MSGLWNKVMSSAIFVMFLSNMWLYMDSLVVQCSLQLTVYNWVMEWGKMTKLGCVHCDSTHIPCDQGHRRSGLFDLEFDGNGPFSFHFWAPLPPAPIIRALVEGVWYPNIPISKNRYPHTESTSRWIDIPIYIPVSSFQQTQYPNIPILQVDIPISQFQLSISTHF